MRIKSLPITAEKIYQALHGASSMPTIPGTIDLGKFRVVYEEEREHGSGESDGYLLQQRAIIR